DDLRKRANSRELRRWVQELSSESKMLLRDFRDPSIGLSLSRFSQVEVGVTRGLARAAKERWDTELLSWLKEADANLRHIKERSRASISLPVF
ncbi:MAG: hypothetical protein ABT940_14600, partial [Alphaproteobacteria bacterium]